jgi:PKD repeat protein
VNTNKTYNILSNDYDSDGTIDVDTLTIEDNVTDGILQIDLSSGNIMYSPEKDYHGTDSFSYYFKDNDGDNSNVATVSIKIKEHIPPIASFSFTPVSPVANTTIQFTDTSTDQDGSIKTWIWDFGDNTKKSTKKNPTHIYSNPGIYSISLKISDDDNLNDTITKKVSINTPTDPTIIIDVLTPFEDEEIEGIVLISGTADAENGVDHILVKIDSDDWNNALGINSWSIEWDSTDVMNGIHSIIVQCVDEAGYSSTAIRNVRVNNDMTAKKNNDVNNGLNNAQSDDSGMSTLMTFIGLIILIVIILLSTIYFIWRF